MSKDKQSDLKKYIPHDIVDPRVHIVNLENFKLRQNLRKAEYDKAIQERNGEIKRLKDELQQLIKKYASDERLKQFEYFYNSLSCYCFKDMRQTNILACAEKIRRVNCTGCPERNNILEKLEARTR